MTSSVTGVTTCATTGVTTKGKGEKGPKGYDESKRPKGIGMEPRGLHPSGGRGAISTTSTRSSSRGENNVAAIDHSKGNKNKFRRAHGLETEVVEM